MAYEIFSLGACLLSAPIAELMKRKLVTNSWAQHARTNVPSAYTFDEALQIIDFMGGKIHIPRPLRELCCLDPAEDGARLSQCFESADAVLVEINSPAAIRYAGYALCRASLIGYLLDPIKRKSQEISRAANRWYNQGLMGLNDTVRKDCAEFLARAVSDDMADPDLARAVLLDSRAHMRDVSELAEGLAAVQDAFDAPVGVVTYTHQYLPDGRPLPWPSDFVEQTVEAAKRLDLPVFNPSEHVKAFGTDRALMPDRVHYRQEFAEAMAEHLMNFIEEMVGSRRGAPKAFGQIETA